MFDVALELEIFAIIHKYLHYGLRRIRAESFRRHGTWLSRKNIHRILMRNNWQLQVRREGHRPRANGWAAGPSV